MSDSVDSVSDLRNASRERLLTEIGMLRKANGYYDIEQLKARYEREILASRDAVFGMSAELGELRAKLRTDIQHARQSVMQTPTWRVGAFVLKPLSLIKRVLRKN